MHTNEKLALTLRSGSTKERCVGFSPEKDKIPKSFNSNNPSLDIFLCVLCDFFENSVVNI